MAKTFEVKTMNGLVRHGEDRRDGIHGEDQVGGLDHQQHQGQRGERPSGRCQTVDELLPVEVGGDRDRACGPAG